MKLLISDDNRLVGVGEPLPIQLMIRVCDINDIDDRPEGIKCLPIDLGVVPTNPMNHTISPEVLVYEYLMEWIGNNGIDNKPTSSSIYWYDEVDHYRVVVTYWTYGFNQYINLFGDNDLLTSYTYHDIIGDGDRWSYHNY